MSHTTTQNQTAYGGQPNLLRSLTLVQVTLYGIGVTIGAGIFVLIGTTAGRAGQYAPISFILAAIVMAFSAMSYAEFAGRVPLSDGSAAYVRKGFKSRNMGLIVGLLVVFAGIVSAAAISIGSTGYIREFIDLPVPLLILIIVLTMGAIASWGITESVSFAALITIIEVAALVIIILFGFGNKPEMVVELPRVFPSPLDIDLWMMVASAGLLAFFAFVGFEDIVTLAEETKKPETTLPLAIFFTLVVATLLYFLVATVAVLSVPIDELSGSSAPLSYVFTQTTGLPSALISGVAIFATVNGVIIQMIMASRVLYGLGKSGSLPRFFASVNSRTRTPLNATLFVVVLILTLALVFPLEGLAEMTSRIILVVFTLINLALINLKLRPAATQKDIFTVPLFVPIAGALTCLAMLASGFL